MPRLDAIQRLWARLISSGGDHNVLDTNSFTESERAVGRMVLPLLHDLRQARDAIDELEGRVRGIDVVLGLLPVPAILLEKGNLLSVNPAARELFGGPAVPAHVVQVAAHAIAEGTEHQSMLAPHPGGSRRVLRVVPAEVERAPDAPAVAFLLSDESPAILSVSVLQERLGLTKMQARVVALIASGRSNPEVAERLGVSVETIRTHIGAVYQRTGVGSRSALVGLAFGVRLDE